VASGAERFYRAWAIVSSLACLALVAYIAAAPGRPDPEAGPGAETGTAGLALPPALQRLPREWASGPAGGEPVGHAVLLDLTGSGELMVERCRHRGYFDFERGAPRSDDWSFCESLLAGSIESVSGEALVVRVATGGSRRIGYGVRGEGGAPRLVLELDEARLELAPGSRNDLFQRLDQLPAILAERDAMLRHALESRTRH